MPQFQVGIIICFCLHPKYTLDQPSVTFHITAIFFFRNSLSPSCACFSFELALNTTKLSQRQATHFFNICCPLETLFFSDRRKLTQKLLSLLGHEVHFYESRNNSGMQYISSLMKAEIKRIDTTIANQLLSVNNSRVLWKGVWLLCGMKRTSEVFCGCRQQ